MAKLLIYVPKGREKSISISLPRLLGHWTQRSVQGASCSLSARRQQLLLRCGTPCPRACVHSPQWSGWWGRDHATLCLLRSSCGSARVMQAGDLQPYLTTFKCRKRGTWEELQPVFEPSKHEEQQRPLNPQHTCQLQRKANGPGDRGKE